MDTVMGSMTTERTAEPTITNEWKWDTCDACMSNGTDEELSDRVATLLGDEIRRLYEEMRYLMNLAFDEVYPDPTPENEEEYFDEHVEWLDHFEGEFACNLGVVHLAKEGDRYILTQRDDNGEQRVERMIDLDTSLSDEELNKQISEFVTARNLLGEIKSLCARYVACLRGK